MAFINLSNYTMKHQQMKIKPQRQKTQCLSWETLMGKKTQQLLQYRFNMSSTMPIQRSPGDKDQTQVQTLAKTGFTKDAHNLAKRGFPEFA